MFRALLFAFLLLLPSVGLCDTIELYCARSLENLSKDKKLLDKHFYIVLALQSMNFSIYQNSGSDTKPVLEGKFKRDEIWYSDDTGEAGETGDQMFEINRVTGSYMFAKLVKDEWVESRGTCKLYNPKF